MNQGYKWGMFVKRNECYLCGKELGHHQYSLRLLDHHICSWCEQVVVEMPVYHINYDLLKEKIKALLIG